MIINNEIKEIIQKNIKDYSSITKQTPSFIHQCIMVSALDSFQMNNPLIKDNKQSFMTWIENSKQSWIKNLSVHKEELPTLDYLYNEIVSNESELQKKYFVAMKFGLVRHTNRQKTIFDPLEFGEIEITEVFYEIRNKCQGNFYDVLSYNDLFQKQLSLFSWNKPGNHRFYIIELFHVLKKIKHLTKEEMKLFQFFFNYAGSTFDEKIQYIVEIIEFIRNSLKNNLCRDLNDGLKLFINNNQLFESLLNEYKDDRLWQLIRDNFKLGHDLNLVCNDKQPLGLLYINPKFDGPMNAVLDCDVLSLYKIDIFSLQEKYLFKKIESNLEKLNMKIIEKNNKTNIFPFKINNFVHSYSLSNAFNEPIFPQKFLYENQDNNYLNSICYKNIILFSNPNSGKSVFVKKAIVECYKNKSINYYHKEISVEPEEYNLPGKLMVHKDISGNMIYGILFETVINAIVNFRTPHINYFDEMGEHNFKDLFGKLKNILKNNNRVDLEKIYQSNHDKINFMDKIKKINSIETLNDFILSHKDEIGLANILTLRVDNDDIYFFFPNNYLFIGTSNYSAPIKQSLNKKDGFAENGDRFKIIHFYEGINKYNFGIPASSFIVNFNRKVLDIFSTFLKEDKMLDNQVKKQIDEVKYQCLLANFEKIDDGDTSSAKKIVISNLEEYTNISLDDIEGLITAIKKVNLDE